MMTLFGPLFAAALMAQFQGRTLQGTVVDDQGEPVADAQVFFHAPAPWGGDAEPVEVRAKTDDQGRFRLTTPRMAGVSILDSRVWAYRPGWAITAVGCRRQPLALVLRKPEPRTVKIEVPGGQPVVGRISPHEPSSSRDIAPRAKFVAHGNGDVPDVLAAAGAITTGPAGTATFNCLAAKDKLMAVRITADNLERLHGNG